MPGGKICSIAICRSNSKTAKENGQRINFFSFPKDPEICKEWVKRCFRKDPFSPRFKRVCSKHFRSQDFEDALKASLMGTQPKRLKKTAIPSLLIDPSKLGHEELVTYKNVATNRENMLKSGNQFGVIDSSKLRQEFMYSQNAQNIILETEIDEPSVTPALLLNNPSELHYEMSQNHFNNIISETVIDKANENPNCDKNPTIYLAWEVRQRFWKKRKNLSAKKRPQQNHMKK